MASPLKATTFLTRSHLSPRATKLLSPLQNNLNLSPAKNNFIKTFPGKQEANKVSIKQTFTPKKSLILDSPNKKSLLSHGLSKHDLLSILGRGSFGTVVKSHYKGETVALKLIKLKNSEDQIKDCNARNLKHENIIKILDILVSDKYGLVIMEYYKNCTNLQSFLNECNNGLNDKTVIYFTRDIAKGLGYCHENYILHLDIKPKNILICNNQICKICDFGNSVNEFENTKDFIYQGTVAYTAPEILKGYKPTSKCDIYSIGILIWQLLTNKNPYEFFDNEVIIYKVVKFNFRPSLAFKNKQLSELCANCWNENPNSRPSCKEICNLLRNF